MGDDRSETMHTETMRIRELLAERQPESFDLSVTVAGDEACCQSVQRLPDEAGTSGSRQLWIRSTITLHRRAGTWQVVAERRTTPFYMDAPLTD
jgi:ketosteroid isomerase-like protein